MFDLFKRYFPPRRSSPAYSAGESVADQIINDPRLAAKFYPDRPDEKTYLLGANAAPSEKGFPIPPEDLWWGYGSSPEDYLAIGENNIAVMKAALAASGGPLVPGHRILDFGCASGIMLRWLPEFAAVAEVWGVDISGRHTQWCQRHLSPPFLFATTTSFPHLPFEDRHFDLVYAGSVFTHIADLTEAWLLELKRITRPGGRIYLTVHDEGSIAQIMDEKSYWQAGRAMLRAADALSPFLEGGFAMLAINRTPGEGGGGQAQVFYHTDYLRSHWGKYLKLLSITPQAYGYQSAILFEK